MEPFTLFMGAPDRLAVAVDQQRITFAELARRVETEAESAPREGVPVLLFAEPSIPFIVRFLSLLCAGCPVAVISKSLTAGEVQQRIGLLGPHLSLDQALRPGKLAIPGPVRCHPETAVVLFTSGSTGDPKAVQLSAENIRANTEAVVAAIDFSSAPRQSLFLALSYSFGLLGQLLPALQVGVPTRVLPRFIDARALLTPGQAAGMWSGVPSQWKAILGFVGSTRLPEVSHIVSAGARLSLTLRHQLHEVFPEAEIYSNYGLTEAAPRVLCVSSRHPRFYSHCTGFPVGGLETRLLESGELCIRGPQVMLGYLGDPQGTAERVVDGWLRTGDHAEIEDDGMVTIHGREDGLINLAGERTSLREIEACLAGVPGVAEATVLVEEDPLYDWRVIGFLVADGATAGLGKAGVLKALAERLSPAKIPRELYLLPEIPLTPNFKIDRGRLRELRAQLTPLR